MTARFNVVCPDKVLFNLEYEDAMRMAHIEYERAKHEYLRRYGNCGMEILEGWQGVEYFAWDENDQLLIVFTERAAS
jgi:hypothetical protein